MHKQALRAETGGGAQRCSVIVRAVIPPTIATLPRRQALAFLGLFFVPGVGQAILLTVVPLEALNLLGDAQAVTLLYVGTGLIAVAGRFSIPFLVRLIGRRFVFTLGTMSLAISSTLLGFNQEPALAAGLARISHTDGQDCWCAATFGALREQHIAADVQRRDGRET